MSYVSSAALAVLAILMVTAEARGKWSTVIGAYADYQFLSVACTNDRTCYLTGQHMAATFNGDGNHDQQPKNISWDGYQATTISMAAAGSTVVATGFGQNAIQYLANPTTFVSAKSPVADPNSRSVGVSPDGKVVVIPLRGNQAGMVLVSTDSGRIFVSHKINVNIPRGATMSVAVINDGTWYISVGTNPNFGPVKYYSASVLRTVNGGLSYEELFSSKANYFFQDIACQGESTCVAVGTGYDANPGVYVYRTSDGTKWEQAYVLHDGPNYPIYQASSITFSSHNEVWIQGSGTAGQEGSPLFLNSKNAGASWSKNSPPYNLMQTATGMHFMPDGTGFVAGSVGNDRYSYFTVAKYTP